MIIRVLSFIFLFSISCFGQGKIGCLIEELPFDTIQARPFENHSSIWPKIIRDSSFKQCFGLAPIVDNVVGYYKNSEWSTLPRFGLGIQADLKISPKWYARIGYNYATLSDDTNYLDTRSYLYTRKPNKILLSHNLLGRISYTPNPIFNFQAGIDRNFIGEGNRSLFLSDYGKAYPFAQIRARFWHVEYLVMYQFFNEEFNKKQRSKYGAMHYLSWNVTKWLNVGVFETVVFQPKDTLLNRGYELEYLNPVIFYRPQEYAIGSSDNVLLGLSVSAKWKKQTVYGQLILDEFLLAEIKVRSGWWANKYGGQLGLKGRFEIKKEKFFYRIEGNAVRPYTYSHLNALQNYGNAGYTLAHPYGGNFAEILGELKWQKKNWLVKTFVSYGVQGLDKNGKSYGGDIYQPYTNRPNDYQNEIGQGLKNNFVRNQWYVCYAMQGIHQVFAEINLRYDSAYSRFSLLPLIGVRSNLWNDYRNY
jgi:hypothetical protein